jgi:hypothetical protein
MCVDIWKSYLCDMCDENYCMVHILISCQWSVDIVRKVFFLCVDLLCDRINMFSCECAYFF